MRHLDLFSGIGGFALAAKTVWGDNYENVAFCDIDPFCQAVLTKNFPNARILGDIKALKGDAFGPIDLITGGFPCQPFSAAGKRRGTGDDRDLWPEMFRIIREAKPRWIIGENVAGFVNMELERTVSDLEAEGYEVQAFIVPACAVGAPHRRDRVWIIAHAGGSERGRLSGIGRKEVSPLRGGDKTYSDTKGKRRRQGDSQQGGEYEGDGEKRIGGRRPAFNNSGTANSDRQRLAIRPRLGSVNEQERSAPVGDYWDEGWYEAATQLCVVDDGLSARLVRLPDGSKISGARWRKEALKGAGNAIVPQVAEQFMAGIYEVDLFMRLPLSRPLGIVNPMSEALTHKEISAKGGKTTMSRLSPEERHALAKKAAQRSVEVRKKKARKRKTFEAGHGNE